MSVDPSRSGSLSGSGNGNDEMMLSSGLPSSTCAPEYIAAAMQQASEARSQPLSQSQPLFPQLEQTQGASPFAGTSPFAGASAGKARSASIFQDTLSGSESSSAAAAAAVSESMQRSASGSAPGHAFVPDKAGGLKLLVDSTGQPITRKLAPSCDNCRGRKVKCVRQMDPNAEDQRCQFCRTQDSACLYDYVPRRPGPRQKSFSSSTSSSVRSVSSSNSISALHAHAAAHVNAADPPLPPPRTSSHKRPSKSSRPARSASRSATTSALFGGGGSIYHHHPHSHHGGGGGSSASAASSTSSLALFPGVDPNRSPAASLRSMATNSTAATGASGSATTYSSWFSGASSGGGRGGGVGTPSLFQDGSPYTSSSSIDAGMSSGTPSHSDHESWFAGSTGGGGSAFGCSSDSLPISSMQISHAHTSSSGSSAELGLEDSDSLYHHSPWQPDRDLFAVSPGGDHPSYGIFSPLLLQQQGHQGADRCDSHAFPARVPGGQYMDDSLEVPNNASTTTVSLHTLGRVPKPAEQQQQQPYQEPQPQSPPPVLFPSDFSMISKQRQTQQYVPQSLHSDAPNPSVRLLPPSSLVAKAELAPPTNSLDNNQPSPKTGPSTQSSSVRQAPQQSQQLTQHSSELPAHFQLAVTHARSLDDVESRSVFQQIFETMIAHLHPLLPILHQPSFYLDFKRRRDAEDPDWLCFTLSLAAYALTQAPRSSLPAPWDVCKLLHRKFNATSQYLQPRIYEPPTLLHLSTVLCDLLYFNAIGRGYAARARLGEATRLGYLLNIHDPARWLASHGGNASNAIETETKRRLFWILIDLDLSASLLHAEPIFGREHDIADAELPLAVDDDLIRVNGAVTQPIQERGHSILAGFQISCRLNQLSCEILTKIRKLRVSGAQNAMESQQQVYDFEKRLGQILSDVPDSVRHASLQAGQQSIPLSTIKVKLLILEATFKFLLQEFTSIVIQALHACKAAGVYLPQADDAALAMRAESGIIQIFNALRELPPNLVAACGQTDLSRSRFIVANLIIKVSAETPLYHEMSTFLSQMQQLATRCQDL